MNPEPIVYVTRQEFEQLQRRLEKLQELMEINTDITADIRAIVRSFDIFVKLAQGLAAIGTVFAGLYATWWVAFHLLKGGPPPPPP